MSFILTIALIIALIFHKFFGGILSKLLMPLVSNTFGAIFVTFLIVVAIITFLNYFSSATQLHVNTPNIHFRRRNKDRNR